MSGSIALDDLHDRQRQRYGGQVHGQAQGARGGAGAEGAQQFAGVGRGVLAGAGRRHVVGRLVRPQPGGGAAHALPAGAGQQPGPGAQGVAGGGRTGTGRAAAGRGP
ncbi:hypothetical protein J1792_20270 [Streptomyces triculaminicus]|uniref:Uncharacterized protein n=1 Tax=Streptomyces triculaminicus TaxID=2816232 RepID=A0A939FNS6_9ACTN|nr:hypothetical protein [Streptomyces triculaminicus]MBO0655028.1 hypothetical protein [Streptomyces triculaminicus]